MNELQIHVSRELFQNALILPQKNQAFKAFTEHLQEKRFSWFHSPTVPDLSKDNKRHYLVLMVFCIGQNTSLDTISLHISTK